jgi:rhodanese-related sulfurtransferase
VGEELSMNLTVMRISKEQLAEMLEDKRLTVIDLRLNWDACTTKIKNAVHEDPIGIDAWSAKYDREHALALYCSTPEEKTSCDAARNLLGKGFTNVRVLSGGWFVWESANLPVQSKTKAPLPGKLIKGLMSD